MKQALRNTSLSDNVAGALRDLYTPGSGQPYTIIDIAPRPGSDLTIISGEHFAAESGAPRSCLAMLPAAGAALIPLSDGRSTDRAPAWSPGGETLAFLSDRATGPGIFQPFIAAGDDLGSPTPFAHLDGQVVDQLLWSPDGTRLLLVASGVGADAPGPSHMSTMGDVAGGLPSWLPDVETAVPDNLWRRAYVVEIATGVRSELDLRGYSCWEAAWLGNDAVAAIVSTNPREGGWYQAQAARIGLDGGFSLLTADTLQHGLPAGSPAGDRVAVIEGRFHHMLVSGDVRLFDLAEGASRAIAFGFDVTCLRWIDADRLFAIGIDRMETVAAIHERDGTTREIWRSERSCGVYTPVAWIDGHDHFLCALESYRHPAELTRIDFNGREVRLHALGDEGTARIADGYADARVVRWPSPDGLEIDGFLALPRGEGPFPLIAFIHGGPIAAFRNVWGFAYPLVHLFVRAGYAVLLPNPRGSVGRGQDFIGRMIGDIGGGDAQDILAGVEKLVAEGIADPERLAVCGRSYGGYMTSWLVTQAEIFAAACAISPMTHLRSQHFTAHHPDLLPFLTLCGSPFEPGSLYDQRSPLMHAAKARTPTLNMAGWEDRTTPPGQAIEFHRALVEAGVETELVVYPGEAHSVRGYEGQIDQAARILGWFERHLG